jgi:hypothetical protein
MDTRLLRGDYVDVRELAPATKATPAATNGGARRCPGWSNRTPAATRRSALSVDEPTTGLGGYRVYEVGIKTVGPSDPDSQLWDSHRPALGGCLRRPGRAVRPERRRLLSLRALALAIQASQHKITIGHVQRGTPFTDLVRLANHPGEPIRGMRCPDEGCCALREPR